MWLLFVSFSVFAASPRDVQRAECLPNLAEARSWPVSIVYLHGLFAPDGEDQLGFRKLEARNRQTLERLARHLHVRVAVPVSPHLSATGLRSWRTLNFGKIEALAKSACRARELSPERAMIGFSNGGYAARRVGLLPCAKTRAYAKIFSLGAPENTEPGRCGTQLVNRSKHEFPTFAELDRNLAFLAPAPKHLANVQDEAPTTTD